MDSTALYEIIEGCKQNDRKCQKLLFELFSKKMMGVCLRYSPNYETARDMVQDGFVKVYSKISSFKGESSLFTWMSRIFINTCLTNLNKAENKKTFIDINDPVMQYKAETPEEDISIESVIKSLPVSQIFDYIKMLPEKYKMVLNLYSVDGYSHVQICETLGIPLGSSKSRLSRARIMLVDIIKENEKLN